MGIIAGFFITIILLAGEHIVLAFLFVSIMLIFIIENKKHKEQKDERKRFLSSMTPEKREEYLKNQKETNRMVLENATSNAAYGTTNTAMMCPHCNAVGKIRTKNVKQKKGVSGGKATAAVLTGGLSLLAVGLSRKEGATQAHCDNCQNTWFF